VYDDGDRVIAVGGDPFTTYEGEIWVKKGNRWSLFADQLPGVLFKVWNGWIVGDGLAYYLDGDTLIERHPPGKARLLTVRGASVDDVWAVGDGLQSSILFHWQNNSWKKVDVDAKCAGQGLNGVFTDDEDDIWIAGHYGTAARFDGDEWTCADAPITNEHFHAAWRHGEEVFFLGGNLFSTSTHYGTIGRYGKPMREVEATVCP
jgi:hypothetical protein